MAASSMAVRSRVESVIVPFLTTHGGRLDEAARRFPHATVPWVDLSTGINPCAYPIAAMHEADHSALPSPSALAGLEAVAARAFGMSQGAIAALPGSEIGLRLLSTIGLPGPVGIVRPCYRTHAEAFPRATAFQIDRLADVVAVHPSGTVLLANPNNPDGRRIAPKRLLDLARTLTRAGGWLVIDEAFADATAGASVLPLLDGDDRVLVLRSFGKFYGLAGVRLGFACGHPAMVGALRDRLGDWPVSAAAIALGTAAYGDTAWAEQARVDLASRADRLDALLRRHGCVPSGDCPLFRLVVTADAPILFDRLGSAGILTRPFDDAPTWLRFGLPADDDASARLDRALGGR